MWRGYGSRDDSGKNEAWKRGGWKTMDEKKKDCLDGVIKRNCQKELRWKYDLEAKREKLHEIIHAPSLR